MRFTSSLLPLAMFALVAARPDEQSRRPLVKRQHLAVQRADDKLELTKREASSLSGLGQIFSGRGTFFQPAINYCHGTHSSPSDMIVAASESLFAQWGGGTESKLCGKKVKITSGDKSVEATITDLCPAAECSIGSLDMSPAVFKELADLNVGLLNDLKWAFVDSGNDENSKKGANFEAAKTNSQHDHVPSRPKHHSHMKAYKSTHHHKLHKQASEEEEFEQCDD